MTDHGKTLMSKRIVLPLICSVGHILFAQTIPTELRITNETAPPGGMAQIKVQLTSPQPISSGDMEVSFSDMSFNSIDGLALFNATGDVVGAAVVKSGKVSLRFYSPNGTFGSTVDYPLLVATAAVPANAIPGQKFPVNLGSESWWQSQLGLLNTSVLPGSITVGGSLSVTNIVPGGGILPAGGTFNIVGLGFSPKTQVSLKGVSINSIRYINPGLIQVSVKNALIMDGLAITVTNPDKSTNTYNSYLRGMPVGQSTVTLLARTSPIFSVNTGIVGTLPSTISPQVNPDYFTALALQNPNPAAAAVTVESHSASGTVTGSVQIPLPAYSRISREVSELFGYTLGTGEYLQVTSDQKIQMLGLLGNAVTESVQPVAFLGLTTPTTLDPGIRGGGTGGGKPKP